MKCAYGSLQQAADAGLLALWQPAPASVPRRVTATTDMPGASELGIVLVHVATRGPPDGGTPCPTASSAPQEERQVCGRCTSGCTAMATCGRTYNPLGRGRGSARRLRHAAACSKPGYCGFCELSSLGSTPSPRQLHLRLVGGGASAAAVRRCARPLNVPRVEGGASAT